MSTTQLSPMVRGVYIRAYKNLRDMWLPWHDGIAIFGANGTGKSNLLEALSILFGARQALELLTPRINDIRPGDLEVIAQVPATELPWPPELGFDISDPPATYQLPGLLRAYSDQQWWQSIGVSAGDGFLDGLVTLGLPDPVTAYLQQQVAEPVIRYSLASANYRRLGTNDSDDPPTLVTVYDRTLLGTQPPAELRDMVAVLPDVFAPLRSALAAPTPGTPDGLIDVLTLPRSTTPPATLQWLPRTRTSTEVDETLIEAYQEARRSADDFASEVSQLGLARLPDDAGAPDVQWWLHEILARKANEELTHTVPGHVAIRPEGGGDADIDLIDLRDDDRELGSAGQENMLDALSAGERRWVDEALAAAARELDSFAERTALYARLLRVVDEERILPELLDVTDKTQQAVDQDGYFGAEALQIVFDALEPALRAAGQDELDTAPDALRRQVLEDLYGLQSLRPTTVIRLFDEPEAHLHPGAQRVVSAALESLRRRGDQVVIATHSPQFLDMPGWQLTHLQRTPEGTVLSPLTAGDLHARKALAGQMGLTRGELLARLTYLLIVEGEHDRLVLETLYGTQLDEAGIGLARMHGTNNLLATAELDFIGQHLDIPVAVLTDNTQVGRVQSAMPPGQLTDEERALRTLRRATKRTGRDVAMFGLRRPDITAYLHPEAVAALNPDFPGWVEVLRSFRQRDPRPSFKAWLYDRYRVDLRSAPQIQDVLQEMKSRGLPAENELTAAVNDIIRTAITGQWPGASPSAS